MVLVTAACGRLLPITVETPHVTLASLHIREVTLLEQRYAVKLRIQNPNSFELPIVGMSFRLDLGEIEFARGVSRERVTVPAYGEELMNVEVVSSLVKLLTQVEELEAGRHEALRYRLSGWLSLADYPSKIPFEYQGEIGSSP